MAKHGRFNIRSWATPDGSRKGISFYCPGCQSAHSVATEGGDPGRNWQFNGDFDNPTLSPSVLVSIGGPGSLDPDTGQPYPREVLCHSFVRDGKIEFLNDSTGHALRGVHLLTPWPDH